MASKSEVIRRFFSRDKSLVKIIQSTILLWYTLFLILFLMFDFIKKLFGKAQSNETLAQVTTQVQQGVDAVQATAQNVVDQAKDIHTEVMADGKINMNDVPVIKEVVQNLAGSVNTIADNVVTNAQEIIADVKDAHAEVMADGKIDMNDLSVAKETVQQVVTNVQEMANLNVNTPTPTV